MAVTWFNTLRPRQNDRHLADDIFKCIFLTENVWISIDISLKFVPKVQINNIPALVQIMAWCRPGNKLLSEPMMLSLLTHICVTRPQWVKIGHQDMSPGNGHQANIPYYMKSCRKRTSSHVGYHHHETEHNGIITRKSFLYYWPFAREIHQPSMNSL